MERFWYKKITHAFTRTVCQRLPVFMLVFFMSLPLFLFLPVSSVQAAYVTASGTNLMLSGSQIKLLGANRYDILVTSTWSDADLATMFSELQAMNATVFRFWAYQDYTSGDTNFSRLDYVVNTLAPTYGVKLIPTLEDQWGTCGGFKYDSWYASGYLSPAGTCSVAYKDHVTTIVNRYKNSPNIAMWDIINEPEDTNPDTSCASGDNLKAFLTDITSYVRSIDANHLITVGFNGESQCGVNGRYQEMNNISNINVVQAHDYNQATIALPGSTDSFFYGKAYDQDNNWTWTDGGYKNNTLGTWTTHTFTIPSNATTPLSRIGIDVSTPNTGWSGTVSVQI